MICKNCGSDNLEGFKFCTGCGLAMDHEETISAVRVSDSRDPDNDPQVSGAQDTIAVSPPWDRTNVPSFAQSYATGRGIAGKVLLVIGGIALALLILAATVVILWLQMRRTDGNLSNNAQAGTISNEFPPGNSLKPVTVSNAPAASSADDQFSRVENRIESAIAKGSTGELERQISSLESKYPNDYRFTYQRARIEAVVRKEHHEAFEMLFAAAAKAIASGQSEELLRDIEKDQNGNLKRLIDHKEWLILENGLLKKDAAAFKVKTH